jgi:hypothetical protein
VSDSTLFSARVDNLLQQVRPYGRSTSAVPPKLIEIETRRSSGESLHQWFVRAVNSCCDGEPKRTAVEDNIAVFVKLAWKERRQLDYANIQTVVSAADLEDYYIDVNVPAQYLRLDFDYKTLGDPFSHPLVHIHVEGDLSPRFTLDGGISGNILVDYLEFLYRNYAPATWLKWAEREWNREFAGEIQDEFAEGIQGDKAPVFSTIVDAFTTGQFQILQGCSARLSRFKQALRKRKDQAFELHMDGAHRELLEYPLAR